MKVLFVSQEFPPDTDWGGIGTYAGIVTREMARAGAEIHVLSVVSGQQRSDSLVEGVHVHRRPLRRPRGVGRGLRLPTTWGRISLAAAVLFEQRRLGQRFDVCETPEWWAEGLGVALQGRLPLVVRLHSGAAQILPFYSEMRLDQRLAVRSEQALIRRADLVTGTRAIVSSVARDLELPSKRLQPIMYPVQVPESGDGEPQDGERQGTPLVLFAGRLEPRKGPDILIRAAPRVLAAFPATKFVFLGADTGGSDGASFAASLRRLAADLGVGDSIELRGRPGGPETVAAELARATVCAVPSRWESMGYVAAEAAALRTPVVASRIAALEEIVEDGSSGRLVPVDDVEAWAQALVEILSAPPELRRRMGNAGHRLIAERCDPRVIAAQTLEAYERAIDLHGRN